MRKLKIEGSDGATELTLKIVSFVMDVFCYSVWQGANYCLQKEVESLWDLEKELSRIGIWSIAGPSIHSTALFEASTESISTRLGRIRNMTSGG